MRLAGCGLLSERPARRRRRLAGQPFQEITVSEDVELLLAEYNNCAAVANHIDNVRNVITSFFLTLNGGVLIAISLVAKGDVPPDAFGSPKALLASVLIAVCTLGTLFTGTLARLRRVQVERYHIANAILDHVLSPQARPIVALSTTSLSTDAGGSGLNKRVTGSYLWTLATTLPTAGLAGLTGYFIAADIHDIISGPGAWLAAAAFAAIVLSTLDGAYFRLSAFTADATASPSHASRS
jgi:hypothetical protein